MKIHIEWLLPEMALADLLSELGNGEAIASHGVGDDQWTGFDLDEGQLKIQWEGGRGHVLWTKTIEDTPPEDYWISPRLIGQTEAASWGIR